MARTYSAKPSEVTRSWYIIDAADLTLGRLSTVAAKYLQGKHKPMYTPHIDCGDAVIVINAAKVRITGAKLTGKIYYRHSGYPGALKSRSLEEQLERDPAKVIAHAVAGMLPKNKLSGDRMLRLKVYTDEVHPHEAQKPQKIGAENGK